MVIVNKKFLPFPRRLDTLLDNFLMNRGGVPRRFPLKYTGPEELTHLELVIVPRGMVA